MQRGPMVSAVIAVAVSAVGLMGCFSIPVKTMPAKITINPQAPSGVTERLPYSVGLHLDPEFEAHHWQGETTDSHGKVKPTSEYYPLGSPSKSLFIETFMRMAREVVLVNGKPPYSGPDIPAVAIVVEPSIVGFGQEHPAYWIYSAHIEYRVIVYDRTGAILLDRVYRGDGSSGRQDLQPG